MAFIKYCKKQNVWNDLFCILLRLENKRNLKKKLEMVTKKKKIFGRMKQILDKTKAIDIVASFVIYLDGTMISGVIVIDC